MAKNMEEIMKNPENAQGQDSAAEPKETGGKDQATKAAPPKRAVTKVKRNVGESLDETTGLNLAGAEDSAPEETAAPSDGQEETKAEGVEVTPKGVPIPPGVVPEGLKIGDTYEQKIDVQAELTQQAMKEVDDAQGSREGGVLGMLDAAEASELEREEEAIADTASEGALQDKMDRAGEPDEDGPQGNSVEIRTKLRDRVKKEFNPADDGIGDSEVEDLLPGYDDDDEPDEKAPEATDEDSEPDPNNPEEYAKFIADLDRVEVPSAQGSVIHTVKDRPVTVVPSSKKGGSVLGDTAFQSAINRFKKDNFPTISVPLINSGFVADIVGTGVVDLTQLYTNLREDTNAFEYDKEKMRVIMRSIVGTHPRINPNQLRSMIHYRDYIIMAWGHICATLDQVETIANCTECGKPFRIKCDPRDLAMNMDEMRAIESKITAADDPNACSLLTEEREYTTENNFVVRMAHPTYAEYIKQMQEFQEYAGRLRDQPLDQKRFGDALDVLHYIRQIKTPDGIRTSNIYQIYLATTMFTTADYHVVESTITEMKKDVKEPKFGIPSVRCPHCGKEMTNLPYENLTDLVFYHSLISQMVLTAQEKSGSKSENG